MVVSVDYRENDFDVAFDSHESHVEDWTVEAGP